MVQNFVDWQICMTIKPLKFFNDVIIGNTAVPLAGLLRSS